TILNNLRRISRVLCALRALCGWMSQSWLFRFRFSKIDFPETGRTALARLSCLFLHSDGDLRAIEFCQGHLDIIVIGEFLFLEDADGDIFAKLHSRHPVSAPVKPGAVASEGNVDSYFVKLSHYG